MRTLIIRLFSPVGEQMTRLQGLVQLPGRHAVRFLGADQLIEVVRTLGWDDDDPESADGDGSD